MTELTYAVALGEDRSCLAALADSSDDMDLSILYDSPRSPCVDPLGSGPEAS